MTELVKIEEVEDGSGNLVSSSVEKLDDMVQASAETVQKMASAMRDRLDPSATRSSKNTEPNEKQRAKGSAINASPPSSLVDKKQRKPKNYEDLRARLEELEKLEAAAETAKKSDRNKISTKQWNRGFFDKAKKQVAFQTPKVSSKSKAFASCVGTVSERKGRVMRGPPKVNNDLVDSALFDVNTQRKRQVHFNRNTLTGATADEHAVFDDPTIPLEPPPGISRFKAKRLQQQQQQGTDPLR